MRLTLTLLGPARLMGARPVRLLEHGSLTLGRAPTAGWVLPDPERAVSKLHCRIDAEPDGFRIADTSTNGTLVNGEALPPGIGRLLQDGDRLALADAEIAVAVEVPVAAPPPPPAPPPPALPPMERPVPAATIPDDPFAAPPPPPPVAAIPDDPFAEGPSRTDFAPVPPPAPAPAPAIPEDGPLFLPLSAGNDSPLQALEESATRTAPDARPSVLDLLDSCPEIDARQLAAEIDAAGSSLPLPQWHQLHDRLHESLRMWMRGR